MLSYRYRTPFGAAAASFFVSACSLTGPLDGYATGEPPDAGVSQDAGSEETGTPQCNAGYTDCDGDPANGCEANLLTDVDHCGSCSIQCNSDHAEVACVSGECKISACDQSFDDCDKSASNGCEVDLTSSAAHCGTCDTSCQIAHAVPKCDSSACAIDTCAAGWGDCNQDLADGCETYVQGDSTDHCGACDTPCLPVGNSTPVCAAGVCGFACKSGYDDCDQVASNGCETDIFKNLASCGACGNECSAANGQPSCNGGNCSIVCDASYDDCNSDVADGCEAPLQTDVAHCGNCQTACVAPDGADATCVSGQCGFACIAGHGDCDLDPLNGCETDLLGNAAHCGQCGHVCDTGACSNGYCEPLPLATGLHGPFAIAVDSTYVYWNDTVDGLLFRQVKDGATAPEVIAAATAMGRAISVDSARVYYATSTSIRAYDKTSSADTELAAGQQSVRAIAIGLSGGVTTVYWVTGTQGATDGTVMRVSATGSSLQQIASAQPSPAWLTLFGTAVYWSNEGTWTGPDYNNDGTVWKSTGTTPFDSSLPQPGGIVVDGTSIVWANRGDGSLRKKDTNGGASTTLLGNQTFDEDLVAAGGKVYWTYPGSAPSTGAVMQFAIGGQEATAVAPQQNFPRRVAVDATHVYWTVTGAADGEGAVYRVVR